MGLVTNQTGVNADLKTNIDLFLEQNGCELVALFAPEHGIDGKGRAYEKIEHGQTAFKVPVFSLHGSHFRPTKEMLDMVDVLVYDIQDIGVRSYTFLSTLCYVMEEAAKHNIPVVVLDRPNPLGGLIDGPMLQDDKRSLIGYLNIPYCHGMTIGELAQFFNGEYNVKCDLHVVPMRGWLREMVFRETGLHWVPTSPQIPESDTPFYYAATGLLGELSFVSIGIGYPLPFKIVGAPWIQGKEFAKKLNDQKLPGVVFLPFVFRPFYGKYQGLDCEGVKIIVTDPHTFEPLSAQYMILGMLKSLYPAEVNTRMSSLKKSKRDTFCKANGNDYVWDLLSKEKYIAWKLIKLQKQEHQNFRYRRQKYLLY